MSPGVCRRDMRRVGASGSGSCLLRRIVSMMMVRVFLSFSIFVHLFTQGIGETL